MNQINSLSSFIIQKIIERFFFTFLLLLITNNINAQNSFKGIKQINAKTYSQGKNIKEYLSEELNSYFDGDGKRTGWKNTIFDSSGKIVKIEEKKYENGKEITETVYNPDQTIIKNTITEFSKNGNIKNINTYNSDQKLVGQSVYKKFDNQGNALKIVEFDSKGKVGLTYQYIYENSKKKYKNYFSNDKVINWLEKYIYGTEGKLTEIQTMDINKKTLLFSKKYNEKELLTEEKTFAGNFIVVSIVYSYLYDDKGTWIERKQNNETKGSSNIVIEETVKRTIDYY